MKSFLHKGKSIVALTLAMAMFCPQVYAADPIERKESTVEVTAGELQEQARPVMTVEDALAKALKYSPKLQDLEDSMELLEEQYKSLKDKVGGSVTIPGYDDRRWTSIGLYSIVSAAYQMEQGMKNMELGREMTELGLEMGVKTMFQTIVSLEDTVKLLEDAAAMQKKTYDQGYTKYRLGMLSKYNLEQLRINKEKAENTVNITKAGLEQVYISFNNLIGANADDRYEFVYDAALVPYELPLPMDTFIRNKMKEDIMIQMQELTLDAAKFKANYRSETDTNTARDNDEAAWDSAKRTMKTAKAEKETQIRNTYLQIKALETEYASAQADLAKAQADFRVAQVSYQTGAVTKLAVEGAAMAVTQAENALKGIIYEHDMLVFQFENPALLGSTQQQQ